MVLAAVAFYAVTSNRHDIYIVPGKNVLACIKQAYPIFCGDDFDEELQDFLDNLPQDLDKVKKEFIYQDEPVAWTIIKN